MCIVKNAYSDKTEWNTSSKTSTVAIVCTYYTEYCDISILISTHQTAMDQLESCQLIDGHHQWLTNWPTIDRM